MYGHLFTYAAVYGTGHSRFTHSISCPSRDNPNAIVRVSEYSKSTTSHNESMVSISLEEQGDHSPLYTETPDEYSTDTSHSEPFSEEDESFSAPNYLQEMEVSDKHIRLEQYREASQDVVSKQSEEDNGCSKPEEFEHLNAPNSCVEGTGLKSEGVAPVKGDEGDAIDAIQVYNVTLQDIFTIPEQKSEHLPADEEDSLQVYSVTLQGIFSITDPESEHIMQVEGKETIDVTLQDNISVSPTLEGMSVPVERAKEEASVVEVLASQGITSDHCDTQADRHTVVLDASQSCNSEDSNVDIMLTTSQDQPDGENSDVPAEGLGSPQEARIDIYDVRFCGIVSYCADDMDTLTQDSVAPIGNTP